MDLASEFPLNENIIHLNHAAVAPWPRRTVEAVQRFAEENMRQGSLDYPRWVELETVLRGQLAQLVNAPSPHDIALVKNTSEALSFVAYGLAWKPGDNIVTSDQEFPSNRIVWESLANRGVSLTQVDLNSNDSPEQALIDAVDEHTRLIAISSVQYGSGLRIDLERLGRFCHEQRILFCVDAIQSIGAHEIDVSACHIDFLAADGHKWMLGPEGLGLFYCRSELREQLQLYEYGWHMVEAIGDFDRREWRPARAARRFECGSPNMLSAHALNASLSLLLEHGMAAVEQAVIQRSTHLCRTLASMRGIELISPVEDDRRAGIVTFRYRDRDNPEQFQRLSNQGLFCALRGGGIRLSPHFYTPMAKLDRTLELISAD